MAEQNVLAGSAVEEDVSFELGDRILILGGRHDGLKGRIYYIDESLIRVLPYGVSDRLVDLSILDGDIDPELGIEELYLIAKRTNPTFVAQIDARVGLIAETFGPNGEPGPKYSIKAVNERADSIVLEDETGAEEEIIFGFIGIPQDEPFAVLRPRQAPEAEGNSAQTEEEIEAEDAANTAEEEAAGFEDLLDDEIAALQPKAENELESDFGGLREIPSSRRIYPDTVQRSDMLQDLISALNSASQKSPAVQKELRKLVEQCILLRNSLVQYTRSGEPSGARPTSYMTVSDMLSAVSVPLARPVIEANRVLYLDHAEDDITNMAQGNPSQEPTEIPGAKVSIKYLADTIDQANEFMSTQLGGTSGAVPDPEALPNWFLSWETLNRQFHSTWLPDGDSDSRPFKEDKEFFRAPVPAAEAAEVDGISHVGNEEIIVGAYAVKKIPVSLLRGLGPRTTRLSEKEPPRRVESAEEGAIINTLIFPMSEQRYVGSIRSGRIAKDIALSHQIPQTMAEILERLEGIPEEATAGGILSVGPGGNTQGNIPLEDWLRALPIYPLGLQDVLVELANYGLGQAEFSVDQQDVLVEKIQSYRALIKQYITELREASTKSLTQLVSEPNPFLTGEAAAEILDILEAEPMLREQMEELRKKIPVYKENDIAIMAGLLEKSADLVLKTLAQQPGPLAKERNRKVRDRFLDALRAAMALAERTKYAGEEPIPNDCPHVRDYIVIKKVKDDTDRMKLFAKFLVKYQKSRADNWVECAVCSQHLVCYHEVLQLQEFLHPREKDTIHKELLLAFSGGQFHGKYMCKNCGQPISEFEFDNNLEFSDEGNPLMGRSILDDREAAEQDQIDQLLGPPAGEEGEIEFTTDTQNVIYSAARRIFDMVGIYATELSYKNIVQRVEAEILKQPSREDYARSTKGRKAIDYDILINRILVGATAANCLIEIQTNIPGYTMRYKMPGCRAGFSGYPMGDEKDRTGVEYIACAVAGIRDEKAPWSLTGFQRESDKKRQEIAVVVIQKLMEALLTNAGVQQQMAAKKAYLKEIYGSTVYTDQLPESIPSRFAPVPYNISDEETAKNAVVPQAATVGQAVRAWVLQAHRAAKENGTYVKGNPYSEATCCLVPIQEPGRFWRDEGKPSAPLPLKAPPKGPTRSHISVHFKPRPQLQLEGTISPEVIYKIFLNVCYEGPHMGLPHEPGYTNECKFCGFVFPENPYIPKPIPPMSSDKATQKELMKTYQEEVDAIITKGKVALETQKVRIDQAAFEEIVDTSHRAFKVEPLQQKVPLAGMKLFEQFRLLEPEPFEGWRIIITETMERLAKLTPKPDDIEVAEAYGPISDAAVAAMEEFKSRLGEANAAALQGVLEAAPTAVAEFVRTYFVVPFQRLITGFQTKGLRVQKVYKLASGTEDDLHRILDAHLEFMGSLAKRANGFTLHKMRWARDRLADATTLLKKFIRGSYIPGGSMGLPYVTTALLGGILAEFINPNTVPPGASEDAAAVDKGARGPIQIVDVCVQKIRQEGLNFTGDQIREMIARRDELEKTAFISRFANLSPEEKAVAKMNKKLGLKEWSVGGTKAIYAYDPEQYEREREQRLQMGFADFLPAGGVVVPGEEAGAAVQEDGYDNVQTREDDF